MVPRRPLRALQRVLRGARLMLCLGLAGQAAADQVAGALFRGETDAYQHCILGDCLEWSVLEIVGRAADGTLTARQFPAGEGFVFEDTGVRFWDVTGDGQYEVVVVLTSQDLGASLAVYSAEGRIAQTPYIGRPNRWLAPVGAADFDGDGRIEVAFVDRPHLAKVLRVFEWDGAELRLEAEMAGLTNHRIGEDFITGGVRDCGNGPEILTVNTDWTAIMVTRLTARRLETTPFAPFNAAAMAAALGC